MECWRIRKKKKEMKIFTSQYKKHHCCTLYTKLCWVRNVEHSAQGQWNETRVVNLAAYQYCNSSKKQNTKASWSIINSMFCYFTSSLFSGVLHNYSASNIFRIFLCFPIFWNDKVGIIVSFDKKTSNNYILISRPTNECSTIYWIL